MLKFRLVVGIFDFVWNHELMDKLVWMKLLWRCANEWYTGKYLRNYLVGRLWTSYATLRMRYFVDMKFMWTSFNELYFHGEHFEWEYCGHETMNGSNGWDHGWFYVCTYFSWTVYDFYGVPQFRCRFCGQMSQWSMTTYSAYNLSDMDEAEEKEMELVHIQEKKMVVANHPQ